MSKVKVFLKCSTMWGFDSRRLKSSSKTILSKMLWYLTPSSNWRFCKSSTFSNSLVTLWISFNVASLGDCSSRCSGMCSLLPDYITSAAAFAADLLFISVFCFFSSAILSFKSSYWSRSRQKILNKVEIISVRMSQTTSSLFCIGPAPSASPPWFGFGKPLCWL